MKKKSSITDREILPETMVSLIEAKVRKDWDESPENRRMILGVVEDVSNTPLPSLHVLSKWDELNEFTRQQILLNVMEGAKLAHEMAQRSESSTFGMYASDETLVEKADLECPSCGAPLKPKKGTHIVECDYCGSNIRFRHPEEDDNEHMDQIHTMIETADEPKVVGNCSVCGMEVIDSSSSFNTENSGCFCDDCNALLCPNCRKTTNYGDYCPSCYVKGDYEKKAQRARQKTEIESNAIVGIGFCVLVAGSYFLWKVANEK